MRAHAPVLTTQLLVLVLSLGCTWHEPADVLTGNAAQLAHAAVDLGGRLPASAIREEVVFGRLFHEKMKPEWSGDRLTVTGFGTSRRTSVVRPGLGATLLPMGSSSAPQPPGFALPTCTPAAPFKVATLPEMDPMLTWAFTEPRCGKGWNTRAVLVVQDGTIVAEHYAPTFSKDSVLLGWSMSKSVLNALVGIMVKQERLSVGRPPDVPEWHVKPGDRRADITLEQLMRMTSGLHFKEEPLYQDLARMLFLEGDMGAFAASRRLEQWPGTWWQYSNGTANIISRALRRALEGPPVDAHGRPVANALDSCPTEAYLEFPYRELFHKLGMSTARVELDASGTFVGSSYVYATARDWARFGLLYLNDGRAGTEQLFRPGWAAWSARHTPQSGKAGYGALFFTNADGSWRNLPRDLFMALGFEGQVVAIVPSRRLVAVRLGRATLTSSWDNQDFVRHVLRALPR